MGFIDKLFHYGAKIVLERPAGKRTLAELTDELDEGDQAAAKRLGTVGDSPENRRRLQHPFTVACDRTPTGL